MSIKKLYLNKKFESLYKHLMRQGFYNAMWKTRYEPFLKNVDSKLDYYYEAFEYFKELNVLDVGCFSGFYSFLISDYANKVVGIDIQEDTIAFADILNYRLNPGNVEFYLKRFFQFVQEGYITKLNINGLFLHNVMGQFHKEDYEILDNFVKNKIKIVICSGYYKKFKYLKLKKKINKLHIYENINL